MSDTDSPTNYQPENQEGSRKRRRLDESYDHASRYSSPDELAASSDLEESHVRRASRVIPRDSHDRQQRSFDDSDAEDSPDELAIHTLYRDGRVRSRRQSTEESVHEDTNGAGNVRSPSPVRKRPTVRYKPGIVLKAHKKGVAAVKISPDGQLIASCCMLAIYF